MAEPTKTRPGDQQLPAGGRECVQDALIALIEERKQLGIQRYGSPLMTHNGRDSVRDATEEALDLTVYLMQVAMEMRDLRAERDHALAELSSLRDHRARWQVEHERAERAEATIERARNAFDGTTPGANGNSKLDALLQRASNGHVSTDDAQNLGRIVTEFLDRLARIQAALEGGE